jgi:hypothetical protein
LIHGPYPTRTGKLTSSLLFRHHLRLKALPENFDILYYALTVVICSALKILFANLAKLPRKVLTKSRLTVMTYLRASRARKSFRMIYRLIT